MSYYTNKLHAGASFPSTSVRLYDGGETDLITPASGCDWQMVVVYRGKHCPMCTRYLNELAGYTETLRQIGVSLVAVSADSKSQVEQHLDDLDINFPLAFGLTEQQMKALGVYISEPRSAQETDHNFAEPGLFVINAQQQLQVVDISNNPFVRPDIKTLVNGLAWIRDPDNHYPIRGTHE